MLRLVVALAALALGVLALVPAPTSILWMAAVAATEWGYLLAVLGLVPLLPGWRRSGSRRAAAAIGLAGAALLLTPLPRAHAIARDLEPRLAAAFGSVAALRRCGSPPRPAPLVAADLLRGVDSPPVDELTRVYARPEGVALELSVRRPPAGVACAGLSPAIIVVHGGSWQRGGRGELAALGGYLAARGYAVVSIDYRLAPRSRFPAARDDVVAAIRFIETNARSLRIDASRLVLLGRSAGGQLALLVAYTLGDRAIRGVISFYAPADLRYAYDHPANPAVLDSRGILEDYLGGPPAAAGTVYDGASPIGFVTRSSPPTLLVHGMRDEMVSPAQSERLNDRLEAAGTPHLLVRLPWATHGCDYHFSGPCGQITTFAVERFLAAVLRDRSLADAQAPRRKPGDSKKSEL